MHITLQHQSGTFNPEALGLVMEERIEYYNEIKWLPQIYI